MRRLLVAGLLLILGVLPAAARSSACDAIGAFEPRRTLFVNSDHRAAIALLAGERKPDFNARLQASANALDRAIVQLGAREGAGSFNVGLLRFDLGRMLHSGAKIDGKAFQKEHSAGIEAMTRSAGSREQVEALAEAMSDLAGGRWGSPETGLVPRLYSSVAVIFERHFGSDLRQVPLLRTLASAVPEESPLREGVIRSQIALAQRLNSARFRIEASMDLIVFALARKRIDAELRQSVERLLPDYRTRLEIDVAQALAFDPGPDGIGFDCLMLSQAKPFFEAMQALGMKAEIASILPLVIARRGLEVETGTDTLGFFGNLDTLMNGRLVDREAYRRGMEVLGRSAGLCKEGQSAYDACAAIVSADAARSLNVPEVARELYGDAARFLGADGRDKESLYRALLGQGALELQSGVVSRATDLLERAAKANQNIRTRVDNSAEAERHPMRLFELRALAANAEGDQLKTIGIVEEMNRAAETFKRDIDRKMGRSAASAPGDQQPEVELSFIDEALLKLQISHLRRRFCSDCGEDFTRKAEERILQVLGGRSSLAAKAKAYIATNLFRVNRLTDAQRKEAAQRLVGDYLEEKKVKGAAVQMYGPAFLEYLQKVPMLKGNIASIATVIALYEAGPGGSAYAPEPNLFFQALIERDPVKKRALIKDHISTPLDSLRDFGADQDAFEAIDDFARHLHTAGYSMAARMVLEDFVRLSRPENEPRADDVQFVSDYQRGLAGLLVPVHARLAQFAYEKREWAEVRFHLARVRAIAMARLSREWTAASEQASVLFRDFKPALRLSAQLATRVAANPAAGKDAVGFADAAFVDLQRAMMSDTALSFLASQRRRVTADVTVADAIRRRSEAEAGLQEIKSFGEGGRALDAARIDALQRRFEQAREVAAGAITRLLPVPEELTSIESISVPAAQAKLAAGEGLLVLHAGSDGVYGMLVPRSGAPRAWFSSVAAKDLEARIASVRAGLDVSDGTLPRFPFGDAHALFELLLGPVRSEVGSLSRLIVVADGPLQALPLGVLPLSVPATEPTSPADYRSAKAEWLALGPSILYLPGIRSLETRGRGQLASKAPQRFFGIGDPQLAGSPGSIRSVDVSAALSRRSLADPDALRRLPALPETAQEIKALSTAFGARPQDILLGGQATEAALRQQPLDAYRIIAFATHGLVTGDLDGLAEPGLVLTPPAKSSAEDDGILTMSEIAQMRLDAELVILSACNTASSDGRAGATGLSGLARAFLTSGARSLIVTHWAIPSGPTVALMTKSARDMAAAPQRGWDYALRSAVRELIAVEGPAEYAHPANWGAFVVFGMQS